MDYFASLQASLRDAKKNFDENISAPLEAFLLELSSQGQGGSAVNFARAGCVIASSAQIYSRKVDYLMLLVTMFSAEITGKRAHDGDDNENERRKRPRRPTMSMTGDYVSHEDVSADTAEIDDFVASEPQSRHPRESPAKQQFRRTILNLLKTAVEESDDAELLDCRGEPVGKKSTYKMFAYLGEPFSNISLTPVCSPTRHNEAGNSSCFYSTSPSGLKNINDSGYGGSELESEPLEYPPSVLDTGDADSTKETHEADESAPAGTPRRGAKLVGDEKRTKTSSRVLRRHASKRRIQFCRPTMTHERTMGGSPPWFRETLCPLSPVKVRRLHRGKECPSGDQQIAMDISKLDTSVPTDLTALGEDDQGATEFSDYDDEKSPVACPAGDLQEMEARVADWEKAIRPLLDAEEERETFQIKRCGERVMRVFDTAAKQTRSFKELCCGLQPWEVARYFAASLELANSGSVTLTTSGEGEAGMDTLCLTLTLPTQNI